MTTPATTKFNLPKTTTYIIMPLAFTGKDKRFEGLTNAYQFLLAEIYTANKAVKAPAKLTYEHFVQKFGMSRDTVCEGLHTLEARGIIKRLGNSRYQILLKFNTKDYIIIDDYLHKQLWNVGSVQKRLARSRIKSLAFLERSCTNPKTGGVFISSQARIGVALNLPRTTAGDSVREFAAAGLISMQQAGAHAKEALKRNLTLYTIAPELKLVKRCKPAPSPDELAEVKALFKQHDKEERKKRGIIEQWQPTADKLTAEEAFKRDNAELLDELNRDTKYREVMKKIDSYKMRSIWAICFKDNAEQTQLESEADELREALRSVLKAHNISPGIFPRGYFYIEI